MAKKLIRDSVHFSRASFLSAAAEAQAHCALIGVDFWNIVQDNFPVMTDAGGEAYSAFGPDETNLPAVAAEADLGALALVTVYSAETVNQPEGEPLAVPKAVYALVLPAVDEIKTDAKLGNYLQELLAKDLLARARRLARAHDADNTAHPLSRDRISALLQSITARGGDPAKLAFKALFPVLQAVMLSQVGKAVAALKDAKRTADAAALNATYSRQRLNATTLFECLQSVEAAKLHFPGMAQPQWENLLKFAIAYAPKHKVRKPLRAEDGRTTLKDAEGKTLYEENIPAPVSPVPFQVMLETRANAHLANVNMPTFDFSDLMAG